VCRARSDLLTLDDSFEPTAMASPGLARCLDCDAVRGMESDEVAWSKLSPRLQIAKGWPSLRAATIG
jgi:hypothetical protein